MPFRRGELNDDDSLTLMIPSSAATFAGFQKWVESLQDQGKRNTVRFDEGGILIALTRQGEEIAIPCDALTFEGFLDWAQSEDFPERGKFVFAKGELHVDLSLEEINTHLLLKSAINYAIEKYRREHRLGIFIPEGVRIELTGAKAAAEPDGTLLRYETLEQGDVALRPMRDWPAHYTLISGSPDWVCEIVSDSSRNKDACVFRKAYHRARIKEYWLIDAMGEQIDFQLLRRMQRNYVAAKPIEGWLKSPVFACWVRLSRTADEAGVWEYKLDMERRT